MKMREVDEITLAGMQQKQADGLSLDGFGLADDSGRPERRSSATMASGERIVFKHKRADYSNFSQINRDPR